jgi:hypothetical protein
MLSPRRVRAAALAVLVAVTFIVAAIVVPGLVSSREAPAPVEVGDPPGPGGLAIGLHEANANLLWHPAARPRVEPAFEPSRRRVTALRPDLHRVLVDWSSVQPEPDRAPSWDGPNAGCLRDVPPCAAFGGVREKLRAVASQQRAVGGWDVVVVLTGTPAWAAEPGGGCERAGTQPRSRPPSAEAMGAYRELIASLLGVAEEEGVRLRWWSPWNEPNHPFFVSPQRSRCERDAPTLAPAAYSRLVRAARDALEGSGGRHELVLGETAAYDRPRARATATVEFARALPRDVACAGRVWAHHEYEGGDDVVDDLVAALDGHGCPHAKRVWITETGAGDPTFQGDRARSGSSLRSDCRAIHSTLRRWHAHPRVDAAFQYTFREDDQFPVGLADTQLTALYPTYAVWRAWSAGRRPADPPPPRPEACTAGSG